MSETDKKRLLKRNTILWLVAMALPAIFHFGFQALASDSARFPWVIVIPFLMVGLLIASNGLLTRAIGTREERSPSGDAA